MKKSNSLMKTLGIFAITATVLSGCDDFKNYTVSAPDDLKDRIDSIASANNPQRGDTLKLDILTAIVGAEDNSSIFWSEFSDYFSIPANRMLHLEFVNYGTGENNWNNWNLCVCNGLRDTDGYSEYFVLRSDAWGWGTNYDGAMLHTDYAETLEGGDMWTTFREKMQGATVYLDIDHSKTGNAYVTATHVATDGTTFTETYEQPVSATADINAFLICDGSHFVMKDAYTITSKVQEVEDQDAVALEVHGTPESIEVNSEDYWGTATATVTFADGSSSLVDSNDLNFTLPDLSTPGTKTIIVSYSKTKLGNYGKSVAAYYTVEVNNSVNALTVSKLPFVTLYYYYNDVVAPVFTDGIEVTATFVDGSTGLMPVANLSFSALAPRAGKQQVTVAYKSDSGVVTTTFEVDVLQGTGIVGLADCSTPWWQHFSPEYNVASGASVTYKLTLLSSNANNWNSPSVILRSIDPAKEYAVVREDNYGWGDGYASAVTESNWNWDTFASNLNGQEITITVTNNGEGTASVNYEVVYTNGEVHFQSYKGITVNSDDLQTLLVADGCCMILHD